jgi:SAM-dependent methyltransferase
VKNIFDLLRDPSLENIDVDGQERLTVHSRMLSRKRMLREVFTEFHHLFNKLDKEYFTAKGIKAELGAGISPMRDSYPDVLATDIVYDTHLDRALNAENMDLESNSVRVLFGQNCFHHFPHPDQFFNELERVIAPGGGVILLDPYYGPFAAFLYKRLFRTEGFDKNYPSWETPIIGPMNGANQALSFIVFVRDRAEFERKHPTLKIVYQKPNGNYLKYILSGGLNFRQLLPDAMSPLIDFVQWFLSPLNRWFSLHHTIVIRKEAV